MIETRRIRGKIAKSMLDWLFEPGEDRYFLCKRMCKLPYEGWAKYRSLELQLQQQYRIMSWVEYPKEENNMPKEFQDLQVGDWIFTVYNGWELVLGVNETTVTVKGHVRYNMRGFVYGSGNYCPTAWTYNPFNDNDFPPFKPSKVGQVIAVRHLSTDEWKYATFLEMGKGGLTVLVQHPGHVSTYGIWRELTAEERGE